MNIGPEIIKLLEENVSSKLQDTGLGNDVLNLTPKAKAKKGKQEGLHHKQVGLHQAKKQRKSSMK